MRPIRRLFIVAAIASGAACGSPLEPLVLDGTLTANPSTATVNQEVTVVLEAQGTRLLSLRIDYDDGSEPEFLSIAGARSARWTRTHAFDTPGTYTISGRVDEATDTLTATATVTVNAASVATGRSIPRVFARKPSHR